MSKNFFNSFFKNFKMVPIHESNKYTFSLGVNLLFLIGGVTSHCVYALITRKNNQSKIIKKYTHYCSICKKKSYLQKFFLKTKKVAIIF